MMDEDQFNRRIDRLIDAGWSREEAETISVSIGDVLKTDDAGNILADLDGEEIAIDPSLII